MAYRLDMPIKLSGACLCGAVEYTVLNDFEYAANCHCSQCRRATGSAFKPFAGIQREKLWLVSGYGAVMTFGDPAAAHDVRCGRCGSLLYSVVRDGTYVHVAMGTLIDDPTIKPSMHIFVDSKANWHQIKDDLPQHAQLPL
jgi:hypothetical protein